MMSQIMKLLYYMQIEDRHKIIYKTKINEVDNHCTISIVQFLTGNMFTQLFQNQIKWMDGYHCG